MNWNNLEFYNVMEYASFFYEKLFKSLKFLTKIINRSSKILNFDHFGSVNLEWRTTHVENFLSQNLQYFLGFRYILNITQAKQLYKLIVYNFYPAISYRRVRKESDDLSHTVTRYGPQSVAWRKWDWTSAKLRFYSTQKNKNQPTVRFSAGDHQAGERFCANSKY